MKYTLFLGGRPSISVAEINAMMDKMEFQYEVKNINTKYIEIDIKTEFNERDFFVQLGGSIKMSKEICLANQEILKEKIISEIEKSFKNNPSKKTIGYSLYFNEKQNKNKEEIKKMFYEIKNHFKEDNSIRLLDLQNDSDELSSASIFQNKLTNQNKGIEFNLIFRNNSIKISKTVMVQDIDSYSLRDYEKPGRDAKIGMTPPKLAQMMINLAKLQSGDLIFDPFCGTGTILQEALLNDYKIIGSDANGEQIEKAKKNLEWISKKYELTYPGYRVFQSGFSDMSKKIKNDSIDAIITESTLGPIYKKVPNNTEIRSNYNSMKKMYLKFFASSENVLKSKGKIVITIPAYQIKPGEFVFAEFIDILEKLGYSILCPLSENFTSKEIKTTKRNSLVYSRPDQVVAREIFVFERNK